MPLAEESICCREVQVTEIYMQETEVDCITELEVFRVHLHSSILKMHLKMNKKN